MPEEDVPGGAVPFHARIGVELDDTPLVRLVARQTLGAEQQVMDDPVGARPRGERPAFRWKVGDQADRGRDGRETMVATMDPLVLHWAWTAGSVVALTFEWDEAKASANVRKHGVRFEAAATAFGDLLSVTVADPDHSLDEDRFILLGVTERDRLVVVAHTMRGDTIRLINARLATAK